MAFEKWAFLTLDHEPNVYASLDSLRQLRAPRITVFREPEWIDMLRARLPNAEVIPIDSLLEYINAPAGRFDATFTGYDRALAYSVAYPQFAAVVPTPDFGSIPIAISVSAGKGRYWIWRTPLSRWEPRRESSRRSSTTGSREKVPNSNGSRAGRSAETSSSGGDRRSCHSSSRSPFGFLLQVSKHDASNQDDAWRETGPVPAEPPTCRLVRCGDASLGPED
jgi:hypothetical protein